MREFDRFGVDGRVDTVAHCVDDQQHQVRLGHMMNAVGPAAGVTITSDH